MKLYVGARGFKPEGFVTMDISQENTPDIVGDIRDMNMIDDESVEEIVASAVLEHIDWPDGFLAMSEFARVLQVGGRLKIGVPDLGMMARLILSGESIYHIVGMMYGLGGRDNRFEQHRYGYTMGMLVDILETLGFGDFDWWNSDMPDASNGWAPRNGGNICVSLNVGVTKKTGPIAPPRALYAALLNAPDADFLGEVAKLMDNVAPPPSAEGGVAPKLFQLLHFRLVDARQRIKYLENLGGAH
jgi:predicted SAM-dependent methyltransferase